MTPTGHISVAIQPRWVADALKLSVALGDLAATDPLLSCTAGEDGGIRIHGLSEPHLEEIVAKLRASTQVGFKVGAPQIAYRETLGGSDLVDFTHKRAISGTYEFARIILKLEPNHRGGGNEFCSDVGEEVLPQVFISGVQKAVNSIWHSGVLIGSPMIDVKVTLHDGAYHPQDSSPKAFEIAASHAMREGCNKAGVVLLEPVMNVEMLVPPNSISAIIADILARRGMVRGQDMQASHAVVRAEVPLANMFGYDSTFRGATNGEGTYSMVFGHYAVVPRNISGPDNFPPAVGMRA